MTTLKKLISFICCSFLIFSILISCSSSSSQHDPLADLGLPPDPGEAGKATIEGIDSDEDGVRDDIQRYIALTYPEQPEIQKALRQLAKADQALLIDADDEAKTMENERKTSAAIECLFSKDIENTSQIFKKMEAEYLNTKERILAQNKADSHLSGHVFSAVNKYPNKFKSCDDYEVSP